MKVLYEINQKTSLIDNRPQTTYGISAFAYSNSQKNLIDEIYDVSSKRQEVEGLVKKCNHLGLSPTHLKEIADDFITK